MLWRNLLYTKGPWRPKANGAEHERLCIRALRFLLAAEVMSGATGANSDVRTPSSKGEEGEERRQRAPQALQQNYQGPLGAVPRLAPRLDWVAEWRYVAVAVCVEPFSCPGGLIPLPGCAWLVAFPPEPCQPLTPGRAPGQAPKALWPSGAGGSASPGGADTVGGGPSQEALPQGACSSIVAEAARVAVTAGWRPLPRDRRPYGGGGAAAANGVAAGAAVGGGQCGGDLGIADNEREEVPLLRLLLIYSEEISSQAARFGKPSCSKLPTSRLQPDSGLIFNVFSVDSSSLCAAVLAPAATTDGAVAAAALNWRPYVGPGFRDICAAPLDDPSTAATAQEGLMWPVTLGSARLLPATATAAPQGDFTCSTKRGGEAPSVASAGRTTAAMGGAVGAVGGRTSGRLRLQMVPCRASMEEVVDRSNPLVRVGEDAALVVLRLCPEAATAQSGAAAAAAGGGGGGRGPDDRARSMGDHGATAAAAGGVDGGEPAGSSEAPLAGSSAGGVTVDVEVEGWSLEELQRPSGSGHGAGGCSGDPVGTAAAVRSDPGRFDAGLRAAAAERQMGVLGPSGLDGHEAHGTPVERDPVERDPGSIRAARLWSKWRRRRRRVFLSPDEDLDERIAADVRQTLPLKWVWHLRRGSGEEARYNVTLPPNCFPPPACSPAGDAAVEGACGEARSPSVANSCDAAGHHAAAGAAVAAPASEQSQQEQAQQEQEQQPRRVAGVRVGRAVHTESSEGIICIVCSANVAFHNLACLMAHIRACHSQLEAYLAFRDPPPVEAAAVLAASAEAPAAAATNRRSGDTADGALNARVAFCLPTLAEIHLAPAPDMVDWWMLLEHALQRSDFLQQLARTCTSSTHLTYVEPDWLMYDGRLYDVPLEVAVPGEEEPEEVQEGAGEGGVAEEGPVGSQERTAPLLQQQPAGIAGGAGAAAVDAMTAGASLNARAEVTANVPETGTAFVTVGSGPRVGSAHTAGAVVEAGVNIGAVLKAGVNTGDPAPAAAQRATVQPTVARAVVDDQAAAVRHGTAGAFSGTGGPDRDTAAEAAVAAAPQAPTPAAAPTAAGPSCPPAAQQRPGAEQGRHTHGGGRQLSALDAFKEDEAGVLVLVDDEDGTAAGGGNVARMAWMDVVDLVSSDDDEDPTCAGAGVNVGNRDGKEQGVADPLQQSAQQQAAVLKGRSATVSPPATVPGTSAAASAAPSAKLQSEALPLQMQPAGGATPPAMVPDTHVATAAEAGVAEATEVTRSGRAPAAVEEAEPVVTLAAGRGEAAAMPSPSAFQAVRLDLPAGVPVAPGPCPGKPDGSAADAATAIGSNVAQDNGAVPGPSSQSHRGNRRKPAETARLAYVIRDEEADAHIPVGDGNGGGVRFGAGVGDGNDGGDGNGNWLRRVACDGDSCQQEHAGCHSVAVVGGHRDGVIHSGMSVKEPDLRDWSGQQADGGGGSKCIDREPEVLEPAHNTTGQVPYSSPRLNQHELDGAGTGDSTQQQQQQLPLQMLQMQPPPRPHRHSGRSSADGELLEVQRPTRRRRLQEPGQELPQRPVVLPPLRAACPGAVVEVVSGGAGGPPSGKCAAVSFAAEAAARGIAAATGVTVRVRKQQPAVAQRQHIHAGSPPGFLANSIRPVLPGMCPNYELPRVFLHSRSLAPLSQEELQRLFRPAALAAAVQHQQQPAAAAQQSGPSAGFGQGAATPSAGASAAAATTTSTTGGHPSAVAASAVAPLAMPGGSLISAAEGSVAKPAGSLQAAGSESAARRQRAAAGAALRAGCAVAGLDDGVTAPAALEAAPAAGTTGGSDGPLPDSEDDTEDDEEEWMRKERGHIAGLAAPHGTDAGLPPSVVLKAVQQEFMVLWNRFARRRPTYSDKIMPQRCREFVEDREGRYIASSPNFAALRNAFVCHLLILLEYCMVDPITIHWCLRRLDALQAELAGSEKEQQQAS